MTGRRRVYRVAEKVRELIAGHLVEMADPRLQLVTITAAGMTADLGEARVYWNVSGGAERAAETEAAFAAANGHFRRFLAERLGLRVVPKIKFFYDETLDAAEAVERIFERLKQDEEPEA